MSKWGLNALRALAVSSEAIASRNCVSTAVFKFFSVVDLILDSISDGESRPWRSVMLLSMLGVGMMANSCFDPDLDSAMSFPRPSCLVFCRRSGSGLFSRLS